MLVLVGGFPSEETLSRLYWMDFIGYIVWIVSAGLYWLDHISIGLGFARMNWLLCAG